MLIFQAFVYNYTIALFTCALTGKKRPFRPTKRHKTNRRAPPSHRMSRRKFFCVGNVLYGATACL